MQQSSAISKESTKKINAVTAKKNDRRSKTDEFPRQNTVNENGADRKADDNDTIDDSMESSSEEEEESTMSKKGEMTASLRNPK